MPTIAMTKRECSMRSNSERRAAPMRARRLAFSLVAGFSAAAMGADLYVIASPEVRLSGEQVREVFLGKRQFAGDVLLRPVDNVPARPEFVSRALQMDVVRYESHWTRKSFREGMHPPSLKSSDRDVINYVSHTRGALGYVTAAPADANIIAQY